MTNIIFKYLLSISNSQKSQPLLLSKSEINPERNFLPSESPSNFYPSPEQVEYDYWSQALINEMENGWLMVLGKSQNPREKSPVTSKTPAKLRHYLRPLFLNKRTNTI